MQELDQDTITDVTLAQMSTTSDRRLGQIMKAVVRHLHDLAREIDLQPQELFEGLRFLTSVGHKCTPLRQEFILLSEVLGLETLVNILNDSGDRETGTRTSILGPFYVAGSPTLEIGQSLCSNQEGAEIILYGRVTDTEGRGIPGASVEVWQTDEQGLYDVQRHDELDMRGRFYTDAEGCYYLRTIRPLGYSIPMDGPVGDLIRAQGRHGMRPAHIHFLVTAPGKHSVTTALYLENDAYIESDTVFGVTASLVGGIRDQDPLSPFPGLPSINFDVSLRSARETGVTSEAEAGSLAKT